MQNIMIALEKSPGLPLTGYVLKVDLVHFRLSYSEDLKGYHCSILGYYYFDPVDARSGRERRSFARARVQNFYNSSMHFCRSFYHNQLAENGYTLQSTCSSTEQGIPRSDYRFNLKAEYAEDSYGNRMLILTKSSCNDFLISYHENSRQRPVDLSYLDKDRSTKKYSRLSFLSDTVRILPSGRIPENSLLFGGSIGEKRIACLLPEDYIPSMQ